MPCLEKYEAVDVDPEALNALKDMCSTSKYKVKFYPEFLKRFLEH